MQRYLPVAARLLLAQLYLIATIIQVMVITNQPEGYTAYQVYLGQFGLPGIFAPLTILIQFLGGLALLLGYKTRLAAYVMAAYSVFVAFALKMHEPIVLMQYLAIAGGMLALAALAPTACSLENLGKSSSR